MIGVVHTEQVWAGHMLMRCCLVVINVLDGLNVAECHMLIHGAV